MAGETASFVVRSTRVGTVAFLDEVRASVGAVTPNVALAEVRTLSRIHVVGGVTAFRCQCG